MTNIKNKLPLFLAGILFSSIIFISCKKDDSENNGYGGNTTLKITDAPFDDAAVSGVFVTIAGIKLDGVSVQGFAKTTVNLATYQNGATRTIGNFNLEGRTYNSITFVLDYDMDASGNAPGSYVLTVNNAKHKLQSTASEITVSRRFDIDAGASNSIVADFDLRKMITRQSGDPADMYDLATAAELESSIRIVSENNAGTISGLLNDVVSHSDRVVAYVYKKGTFNRATELQAQGTSGIQFKNAVSSSLVSGRGQYEFHFLESGDYEVHFASYRDANADGEFELAGTLIVTGLNDIDLLNLSLGLNASLSVDVTATGVAVP